VADQGPNVGLRVDAIVLATRCLDLFNALAAYLSHDDAFGAGLLTAEDDLRFTLAASLSEAARVDRLRGQY
jgi:hypothetical protein